VRNRLRLLEQIIEDAQVHPAERREAEAEREVLVRECAHWQDPVRDNATRAVDAVRKALTRLVGSLERATDAQGQRQETLRAFGQHLRRYVMLPSGRGWGARTRSAFPGGRFTYEPPDGVVWQVK
jgi:hypothetical protein